MSQAMAYFAQEAPAAAAAFSGLIDAVSQGEGLDGKTKQLIYIAIKASQGDEGAVLAHTWMAKAAGATRDELKDAILMTLTVCGIRGVVSCLQSALTLYDQEETK